MTVEISTGIKDAVTVGVIELMVQPEYGNDWVESLLESYITDGSPITEEMVNQVTDMMNARLRSMAVALVDELTDEPRAVYEYLKTD